MVTLNEQFFSAAHAALGEEDFLKSTRESRKLDARFKRIRELSNHLDAILEKNKD